MRLDLSIHGGPVSAGVLLPVLILAAVGMATFPPPARADLATTGPVFTNPTEITNPWCPVNPGGVKVYIGRDGTQHVTVVETHQTETRTFDLGGGEVECRIVDTLTFLKGKPIERERRYLAQADDGSVYCFGETDEDEEGDVDEDDDSDEDEPNGWVVGQLAASDPPDAIPGSNPSLWMPADPQAGDAWAQEEHPPAFDEQAEVRVVGEKARVPAGRYPDCLRIRHETPSDESRETAWYARGTGLVKISGNDTKLRLQATTIR